MAEPRVRSRLVGFFLCALILPWVTSSASAPSEQTGGTAILLEMATATWCTTCASVDPVLDDFISETNGRVIRLSLHAFDGSDPLGNDGTSHRLTTLGFGNSSGVPTIYMDGSEQVIGTFERSDLHRSLAATEASRPSSSRIRVVPVSNSQDSQSFDIYLEPSPDIALDGAILIYLVEAEIQRPEGSARGGTLANVVRGIVEAPLDESVPPRIYPQLNAVNASSVEISNGSAYLRLSVSSNQLWDVGELHVVVAHQILSDRGTTIRGAVSTSSSEEEAGNPSLLPSALLIASLSVGVVYASSSRNAISDSFSMYGVRSVRSVRKTPSFEGE